MPDQFINPLCSQLGDESACAPTIEGGCYACDTYDKRNQDADWLWCQLMDWCRARCEHPANHNELFAIVDRLRKRQKAAGVSR